VVRNDGERKFHFSKIQKIQKIGHTYSKLINNWKMIIWKFNRLFLSFLSKVFLKSVYSVLPKEMNSKFHFSWIFFQNTFSNCRFFPQERKYQIQKQNSHFWDCWYFTRKFVLRSLLFILISFFPGKTTLLFFSTVLIKGVWLKKTFQWFHVLNFLKY
jgi:hypothetical protein